MSHSCPDPLFTHAFDIDEVQRVVVAAALKADPGYLAQIKTVQAALDEPYRSILAEVLRLRAQGGHIDRHVLGAALQGRQLYQVVGPSRIQSVSADQVINLLFNSAVEPGQPEAYLALLRQELDRRRKTDLKARLAETVMTFSDQPDQMLQEVTQIVTTAGRTDADLAAVYPTEILEIFPYAKVLQERQRGQLFEGLDSGFGHLNHLCNGLGPELFILAAPPGEGKTTLCWQICCQVAALNQVPVIVISQEQSKTELRAKALARLSHLDYRHILRGRLRSDDPEQIDPLLEALSQYAKEIAPYLTVVEGGADTTAERIRSIVAAKMRELGASRGLVMVDYLQALPLSEAGAARVRTTKDRIDLHVSGLRQLARDLGVAVLCISSENRTGYGSKKMDVFKESGGIEYSSDIAAVLTQDKAASATGHGEYRVLDINIVKNRNGERGVVKFKFYPKRAEFVDTEHGELPQDDGD